MREPVEVVQAAEAKVWEWRRNRRRLRSLRGLGVSISGGGIRGGAAGAGGKRCVGILRRGRPGKGLVGDKSSGGEQCDDHRALAVRGNRAGGALRWEGIKVRREISMRLEWVGGAK